MNKKNGLKALLVLLIFCSLGIILKNIVEYESDGAVDVEVSEFISYQEIDYSLKKDDESMVEFELNQAKDFLYNEETIYLKQTRIKSLNIDICEGDERYYIIDYNAKEEIDFYTLDDLFDYLEAKVN